MRRALALGLALLALAPASASADHGPPATDPAVVLGLQVAAAEFGAKPCVHAALAPAPPFEHYPGQSAAAEQGGCRVWIVEGRFGAPERPASVWCQVVVHEVGHAVEAGDAEHTRGPPVMLNPWVPGLLPGCAPADAPLAAARAEADARAALWRRYQRAERRCTRYQRRGWPRAARRCWRRADALAAAAARYA